MDFVNNHTDLCTVNYMSKSARVGVLEKALEHTGLVQKDIQYRTPTGKIATRKQWVKAGDEQHGSTKHNPVKEEEKRNQLPATPFNTTERLKSLVSLNELSELPQHIKDLSKPIPPSWRNVMVSIDSNSDVLAVGKDDMDRPQYIYNEQYVNKRKAEKFKRVRGLMDRRDELSEFINGLDDRDTGDCLDLILQMGIRPGSTRNTRAKVEAIGATTMRGENVVEEGGKVFLRFVGKKGVNQDHVVTSDELGSMLLKRKSNVGDHGNLFKTNDTKLRIALKVVGVKPKDLRTMLATTTAQELLSNIPTVYNVKDFIKIRNHVGDKVSEVLGNQRTMALNSYIDPIVFKNWLPKSHTSWMNQNLEEVI